MTDSQKSAREETRSTGAALFFERIGLLGGTIASLSMILSVFYDWGFFTALGISFADAPTTLSDHMQSWLVWLPIVAPPAVFVLGIELLTRRIERGMTEDEIIATSPSPVWMRRIRDSPYYFMGVMGPLLVIFWVLFGEIFFDGLFFGLSICWFLFIGWIFGHPTVKDRHSALFRWSVYWLPPVMIAAFFLGSRSVERAFFPGEYKINVRSTSSTKDVEILRSFERWVLVREEHNTIAWISLEDIGRMELVQKPRPFRGLACIFWKNWCPRGHTEERSDG